MALFELFFLSLVLVSLSIKTTILTQAHCLPPQRDALIQLKQGFNTTKFNSWNASTDCCIWDGITCEKQTGMVTALNLNNQSISGKLNPALFNLSSLQQLDLSDNYFLNITLPQTGFERLANLTHLSLYNSGFVGQVPTSISALTKLTELDLSFSSRTNQLYLRDTGLTALLSNLTKLQFLYLDDVNIALDGSEWVKAVFQVGPTLQQLSMSGCGLRGNLPEEMFHLKNLTYLELSSNDMLSGQLPEFKNQSLLQYLSFSLTNLTGPLPDSIGNLQYLSTLSLFKCNIYGEIPPSITNLTRLEDFNLGLNRLTGRIPMSLFSHPSLEYIVLSNNQLSGYLPEFSNGSSILKSIHLGSNNLQGQLTISIFKLPLLMELSLDSNNFTGAINLEVIKHNKLLEYLDLSNNMLSIIEGESHNESFYASFPKIQFLRLASCNLTRFPSFLRYQRNFTS